MFKHRHSFFAGLALVASAALGCGSGGGGGAVVMVPAGAPGDLDGAVQAQAAAQAPGTTPVGAILRGAGGRGGRTEFHLQLVDDKCYWFSAAGDPGVGGLGLYLWGSGYFRVASAGGKGPQAVLMHCPRSTGMYRLQAKVRRGGGAFAVGVYAKAAPPKPPPPPEDLGALVEAEAAATAPGASRVGELLTGEAERHQWQARVEAGSCYWWVAHGEESVKEVSLFLYDSKRRRLDHNKTPARKVTLAYCPRRTSLVRLELKVHKGTGRYKVGLYGKSTEAAQPAAPAAQPEPMPQPQPEAAPPS